MLHWATEGREAFMAQFPNGKFDSLQATVRHLLEGLFTGTYEEHGPVKAWLYTAN